MMRIAIVDDCAADRNALVQFIERYQAEKDVKIDVRLFEDGLLFLDSYEPAYNVVFLDIEMPRVDGMTIARKLRDIDEEVNLVFVTNLEKYAVEGYSVQAVDFIVKPFSYTLFAKKFDAIVKRAGKTLSPKFMVKVDGGCMWFVSKQIHFVEVMGHYLYYHTDNGIIKQRGSISSIVSDPFFENDFFMCNKCYMVNLAFVKKLDGYDLYIGDEVIKISRPKKLAFMSRLADYLGRK